MGGTLWSATHVVMVVMSGQACCHLTDLPELQNPGSPRLDPSPPSSTSTVLVLCELIFYGRLYFLSDVSGRNVLWWFMHVHRIVPRSITVPGLSVVDSSEFDDLDDHLLTK